MHGKKKFFRYAIGLAALLGVAGILLFCGHKADGLEDNSIQDNQELAAQDWGRAESYLTIYENEEGFLLDENNSMTGTFELDQAGNYELWAYYQTETETLSEYSFTFELADGSYSASLPVIWSEDASNRTLDRYGDEMNADAELAAYPVSAALIQTGDVAEAAMVLALEAGEQEFTLSVDQEVRVYALYLVDADADEETAEVAAQSGAGNALVMVEAENYTLKSDSYIRGKNIKNAALSPYETYTEKINALDSNSWDDVGQKILWVVEVEEDGWYRIGFRYSQYSEANKFSYRSLCIDGLQVGDDVIAFPSTGMNAYKNLTVQEDGEDLWIYLEAGEHTIAMEAVMDPLVDCYNEILDIMDEINDISMQLRKLTAGNTDENRTWDMDEYLPEVPTQLEECRDRIQAVYQALWDLEGVEPSYATQLLQAVQQLENLLEDKRLIPNKQSVLSEGDGSVNSALGEVLAKLTEQPLSLDRIYLYQDTELPSSSVSILTATSESLKRLAATYLPGAEGSDYEVVDSDSGELEVWVNMSISYAEVLQQLLDETYNSENGTNITISVMSNEQKIVLSNATGSNPDVLLGINYYTPYELAIRGAAKNLLEYDDFAEFYSAEYNIAGLTPLAYDGGIYGAVDSLNYQVLFYRKDILDSLGLEIPQTWEDVQDMMPTLLRYSMNFYTSLATSSSFKTFNMTGPFVYQNGGTFYSEDGSAVAFNEISAVDGLKQMTDLFEIYSLTEYTANFFNSFRYGDTPIGVGNFSTYVQLMSAAPELEGQWGIALVPGTLQEDGTVDHSQAADSTACMIFENTDMPDEAWDFLKWWLSSETQTEFSNRLERAYGAEYRWNTANLVAFESLPYSEEDKEVILEQISYQQETARHPAGYMIEREVSNIWNEVVVNGEDLTESIDRAVIASDREIIRKLKEFGFMDEDGNLIKPYTTEDVKEWLTAAQEDAEDEKGEDTE